MMYITNKKRDQVQTQSRFFYALCTLFASVAVYFTLIAITLHA